MVQNTNTGQYYICPMHSDVREPKPGNCPKCGMELLPEGTRFGMIRHIISSPMHVIVMAGLILAVMAAVMMMVTR